MRADNGELVVVSWGGDYDQALRDLVLPSFEKATGYTVKLDAPPEIAKVKAMVQSGNVSWDVLLTDIPAVMTLMQDNLLEALDYSAIDKAKLDRIPKELQRTHALGQRIYSFNIVYNTNELPKAKHPRNWAEVWDGQGFPGSSHIQLPGRHRTTARSRADGGRRVDRQEALSARRRAGLADVRQAAAAGQQVVYLARAGDPADRRRRGKRRLHHRPARHHREARRCADRGRV